MRNLSDAIGAEGGSGAINIIGNLLVEGEASGALESILVDPIHSGSPHHDPDATLLSGTFAIDSTGIKTLTVPHGLGYTPAVKEVQLTVAEDTVVDDWGFNLLKVISVDSVNVTVKVNVSAASATGGATAKLAILLVGISVGSQASRSMAWYQQHPTPKVMRKPQPRWLNIPYEIIGGDIGVPIPSFGWFEQPPTRSVMLRPQPRWLNSAYVLPGGIGGLGLISIEWYQQNPPAAPRRRPGTREGIAVIAPSQLP